MTDAVARAARFNQQCDCIGTDVPALHSRLAAKLGVAMPAHLFADVPVFLAAAHARQMQRVINAVEAIVRLPAYREQVLAIAPAVARQAPLNKSVFFGFDFHITADGPKLIEINTNAGGALLNVEMQRAQQPCCTAIADSLPPAPDAVQHEAAVFDMFMHEWRLARGARSLRTIAIVDDDPRRQFLYPEFLLFKQLFEARGIRTFIADARELAIDADSLSCDGHAIDLVYNRSTDFCFVDPGHEALAQACRRDLAVITPHPHAHALYANKANLALLSDAATLRAMHASAGDIEALTRAIPETLSVTGTEARWWDERKQWFFKPVSGFGGRGAYRGDKITHRVFGDVMKGDYIAQRITPPSERRRRAAAGSLKLDVRSYVYNGMQLLLAARLYQGQTTNFRTDGGGFAPIYQPDDRCTPSTG